MTEDEFHLAMDLLLGSVLFGMKHAAPIMKAQGRGAIINNASVAAQRTHMGQYLYSIAKAAVRHATVMAGMELGSSGVTCNSISPGGVATPIFFGGSARAAEIGPVAEQAKMEKLRSNLAKANPMHRTGMPKDIAHAAAFLASDEGAYINCHDLVVDGGMIAGGRVSYE